MGWGVLSRPRLNVDRIALALHAAEGEDHRAGHTSPLRCEECTRRADVIMGVVEDSSPNIDKWDWR